MLRTVICDLLNIRYPVFQGGMAHIGTWKLVSSVSNAGGLGIIGAGFYQPDWVEQQIKKTKQHTDKPFGVNIQLASPYLEQVTDIILKNPPAVVTTGAGNPESLTPRFREQGIKTIPVVNSGKSAKKMESAGADAIIAEGMESGGHIGETTTMVLIPEVVAAVKLPVIAAGGICNGSGMAAALALGASGIQMGTRFVCSTECIAHVNYKNRILEASDMATTVTRQLFGYPQRSLINDQTERFKELEKAGIPVEELEMFDKGRMYLGLVEGDIDEGALLAGQTASLINDIKPVKDIIDDILSEAENIISSLNNQYLED